MEENTDYDKDLEEAIKMSLTNFTTQPKKSQVAPLEDVKAEEGFFQQKDLKPSIQADSDPDEEEKVNPFWEESKEQIEEPKPQPAEVKEELSQNPPVSADPGKDLCKEYMVILEANIGDEKELKAVLTILEKLIGNVCKDPNNTKFHKIKLNNKKIQSTVGKYAPALFLLELVGFRMSKEEDKIDQFTTQTVDVYNLDYDNFNFETFQFLHERIKTRIQGEGQAPTVPTASVKPTQADEKVKTFETMEGYNNKYVPMNSKRRKACERLANKKKNNTNMLYELAQQRAMRKATTPQVYQNNPYDISNVPSEDPGSSVMDQLSYYRNQRKRDDYRVPKEITVKDLDNMNKAESMNVDPTDIKRLGKSTHYYTNRLKIRNFG